MFKPLVLALATAAGTLVGGAAHAGGHVSWSVGINVPVVGAVISNAPVYYGRAYQPVYEPAYEPVYAPQPVYVPAPPVYRVPPPVAYYPAPVVSRYYRPVPVVYGYSRGWHHDHRYWQEREERHESRWGDHDHRR